MTNAHLEGYQPGGVFNVTGGKNLREIIAILFAMSKTRLLSRRYAARVINI
jgi:hypothetical protein